MSKFKSQARSRLQIFVGRAVLLLSLIWPCIISAQNKSDQAKESDPHSQHKEKQPTGGQDLGGEKQSSAWWFENYTRGQKQDMSDKGMAHGEGGMGDMTGKIKDRMDAGSMAGDSSSSSMGMIDDVNLMGRMDDGMSMMGVVAIGGAGSKSMNCMDTMQTASSLPGSPGISKLYHIGATGFFLNHAEHITLSTTQQAALNRIKQKALLSKSTAQRKIDEAEQELWELTGADEPDAALIESKVQTIEKLRAEPRMAFIKSVGEAVKVLTDEQRQMLLGTMEPDASPANAPAGK